MQYSWFGFNYHTFFIAKMAGTLALMRIRHSGQGLIPKLMSVLLCRQDFGVAELLFSINVRPILAVGGFGFF